MLSGDTSFKVLITNQNIFSNKSGAPYVSIWNFENILILYRNQSHFKKNSAGTYAAKRRSQKFYIGFDKKNDSQWSIPTLMILILQMACCIWIIKFS